MSDRCDLCRGWYPEKAALCPKCRIQKPKFHPGTRVIVK